MSDKRSFDAVVVGGGIIGLACAWRAAQGGAEVALVERAEDPPAGATRVAAGMLAPVGELSFGEPELLQMTRAAADLYPGFVEELERATGVSTGYRRIGALHVALDRDEAAELRRVHELQRSLELGAEWLPPRRCRDLEPGLTPSFNGGVLAEDEAAVDPRALAASLLAALEAEGATVLRGAEVSEATLDQGRVTGVRTEAGEELLGTVVVATGAWSGRAAWLPPDARPPVRPVKGQVLELRPRQDEEAPCRRIVGSERVYLVPRPDGRLIVGATAEEQGFDTAVTAGGVHELLREAYRLVPDVAEMELIEAAAGLRPGTPDNLPRLGPSGVDGVVWATGHFRNGILLAPLAAQQIADLLGSGHPGTTTRSSSAPPTEPSSERSEEPGPGVEAGR